MACDLEKIEDNEQEKPNTVIQLNTLGLDELISLTLKDDKRVHYIRQIKHVHTNMYILTNIVHHVFSPQEWKLIKKNYAILEGAIVTYDKCKNSVEQLNPDKFGAKNYNAFINELERSDLIKLTNQDQTSNPNTTVDVDNLEQKENIAHVDNLIENMDMYNKKEQQKEGQTDEQTGRQLEKQKKPIDVHIPLTSLVFIPVSPFVSVAYSTHFFCYSLLYIHTTLYLLRFLPGKIVDTENFLIRMGTNYYVQRNAEQTIEYFNNKIKKLNEQIRKLKITIIEKKNDIDLCKNYIQIKREQQMNALNANRQAGTSRAVN
ncbi:prefoldin subunit 5, putative [Plasmodium ovale wallikeri]|uniref:Prefoldin subunit 5, putative n=1 Tax=Plasmodium ovale wallikeri TaxID=864142 RepID=A0A1A8YWR6_PLAOA|nr:prefoldin subunit 5, putative [Plasmodium ovale wallikeri]